MAGLKVVPLVARCTQHIFFFLLFFLIPPILTCGIIAKWFCSNQTTLLWLGMQKSPTEDHYSKILWGSILIASKSFKNKPTGSDQEDK